MRNESSSKRTQWHRDWISCRKRHFCRAWSTGAITSFKYSVLLNAGGVLEVLSDTSQLLEAKPAWQGFTGNSRCWGSSWGPPHHRPRTGTTLEVLTPLTAHRGGFFGCRLPGKAKTPPFQAWGLRRVCLTTISAVNRTMAPQLPKIIKSRGNPNLISKCCPGAGIIQGLKA